MHEQDYEYYGLMAATWDLFRGDTSTWSDRFFFRDLVAHYGQPVLDVGCGTGRLLLDYLQQGLDVDGVDNSPDMLALCLRKAQRLELQPRVALQMMGRLDLRRRYRTILVPSSSFQLLLEPAQAQQALRCFYEHLEPGGALIMPFFIPSPEELSAPPDWALTGERVRPEDGLLARRWSKSSFDQQQQLEHTETRYELSSDGQVVAFEEHRRSPATRWYTQAQALALYEAAGFFGITVFSGFSHDPARPEDRVFTLVGLRP